MQYVISAECRSCQEEQDHIVDMSDDPSDAEVTEALAEQGHDCDGCGDNDWSQMGFREHHP